MFSNAMFRNSFQKILDEHKGIGPGFDAVRILLSTAVFIFHTPPLFLPDLHISDALQSTSHMAISIRDLKQPIHLVLLPMFFAVSGFLVLGSALRVKSVSTFLAFRALRIFPALATEVVLSAIVLGAIFTSLPLSEYFTNTAFFRYFGNMIGWVVFELPGVFSNHRTSAVNANLWTLPPEFDCYFITAFLMITGLLVRRGIITAILLAVSVVFLLMNTFGSFAVVASTEHYPTHVITYYFFVGMLFYYWRGIVPHSLFLFVMSALAAYIFLFFSHTVYLAPVFVTYCILYIGLLPIPKSKLLASGDYSYGIYLYGFPISQSLIAAAPGLRGHWLASTSIALLLTITFAVVSWHLIEKPTLALKKSLPAKFFPRAPRAVPLPEQRNEQAGPA